MIMNPDAHFNKDLIKLAGFIDSDQQNYFIKLQNLKYYMAAN